MSKKHKALSIITKAEMKEVEEPVKEPVEEPPIKKKTIIKKKVLT